MAHHLFELPDGRHAGVTGLGDPRGRRLVVMCHPSPGAGAFDPDPPATSTTGVRIITLDRPGYGASDPLPDEADPLGAWLDDVDEYLQTVENIAKSIAGTDFGAVGVIGWGVGAVYATALAARRPGLVNRLALIEPTGNDAEIVQNEVFGPVLTYQSFRTEEEAIALANSTRYGLSAILYTSSLGRADRVGRALRAGTVWVNTFLVRDLTAPFGGMGESGIGREGGDYALDFYSDLKTLQIVDGSVR